MPIFTRTRRLLSTGIEPGQLRLSLGLLSLTYLSLPIGIFLVGWLCAGWAISTMACLLAAMALFTRRFAATAIPDYDKRSVPWRVLVGTLMAVTAVVAVSGPGGFGIQTWDWGKHNAILQDLLEQPWPVAYATERDNLALTYYVAYYLPAALVGKVAGWRAANVALYTWTVAGCALTVWWLMALSRAGAWLSLLVFVLFSGLDVGGSMLWCSPSEPLRWLNDYDLEWWARYWAYPGNATLIAFAPHQAIAGWLLTALTVDALRRYQGTFPCLTILALSLLWSPFVTVGLITLLSLTLLKQRTCWRTWSRHQINAANLAAAVVGTILTVYFLSRYAPFRLPEPYYPAPHRMAAGSFQLTTDQVPLADFLPAYAVFVLLEFLILALLLFAVIYRHGRSDLPLLWAVTVSLLLLPFFTFGYYNDLVMRVSIPALFVLQILTLQTLSLGKPAGAAAVGVMAVVAIAALYPLNMLRLDVDGIAKRGWDLVRIPPRESVVNLFQWQLEAREHYFFIGQYVGSLDSLFFRLIAKPPVTVAKPVTDVDP